MSLHRLRSTPAGTTGATLLAINLMTWTGVATDGAPGSLTLMVAVGAAVWATYLVTTTP